MLANKSFQAAVRFFTIALAGVGAAALLNWLVLPRFRAENRAPDYVKETMAPDSKMKAVLLTYAGGGAFAPYCFDRLAIVPAGVRSEDATALRYEVYRTNCGTFANHEKSPKLDWASNDLLKITISIDQTALHPQIISIKGIDETKTVKVELSTHE